MTEIIKLATLEESLRRDKRIVTIGTRMESSDDVQEGQSASLSTTKTIHQYVAPKNGTDNFVTLQGLMEGLANGVRPDLVVPFTQIGQWMKFGMLYFSFDAPQNKQPVSKVVLPGQMQGAAPLVQPGAVNEPIVKLYLTMLPSVHYGFAALKGSVVRGGLDMVELPHLRTYAMQFKEGR